MTSSPILSFPSLISTKISIIPGRLFISAMISCKRSLLTLTSIRLPLCHPSMWPYDPIMTKDHPHTMIIRMRFDFLIIFNRLIGHSCTKITTGLAIGTWRSRLTTCLQAEMLLDLNINLCKKKNMRKRVQPAKLQKSVISPKGLKETPHSLKLEDQRLQKIWLEVVGPKFLLIRNPTR